ncbi:MAG TPA: hypothetical protein VIB00_08960 [Pyrinomonadaceae bacterium]|jgi:hypothetical protein
MTKRSATHAERPEKKESWDSNSEEALREDERSLDIGESGQFAPGGYYNQRKVNEPRRIDLDDDIVPPARESSIERNSNRD